VREKKHKNNAFNENWEKEIAAYDEECHTREIEFFEKHVIIKESGSEKLTQEENDILILYLNGIPCNEIAQEYKVEEKIITGLLEIIRAKLSLEG